MSGSDKAGSGPGEKLGMHTRIAHAGRREEWTGPVVNPPIWRASTHLYASEAERKAAEAVEVDDTPPSDELKLFEVSDAHEDFVRCVCFDHHKLLSCADDGRVYLFSFDA